MVGSEEDTFEINEYDLEAVKNCGVVTNLIIIENLL